MTIEYDRDTEVTWTEPGEFSPHRKPCRVSVSHHSKFGNVYIHVTDGDGETQIMNLEEEQWHALSILLQEVAR